MITVLVQFVGEKVQNYKNECAEIDTYKESIQKTKHKNNSIDA